MLAELGKKQALMVNSTLNPYSRTSTWNLPDAVKHVDFDVWAIVWPLISRAVGIRHD